MVDTTGTAAPTGERRTERLELRVPTSPTQLPAVRAMTGDLAMRMDFDLDAVEDLRLAVDEACATLASVAQGDSPLTVVFEATREGLRIDVWVPTAAGVDVPRDGFGWAVLHTLVDTVEAGPSSQATVAAGNGSATPVACISLVKQLRRYSASDTLAEQPDADVSVAR
jgi:serine/threonine-protein kinase RsbW